MTLKKFIFMNCILLSSGCGNTIYSESITAFITASMRLLSSARNLLCSVFRIYEGGGSWDLRKMGRFGPMEWSGWLSSSSTTKPHIN